MINNSLLKQKFIQLPVSQMNWGEIMWGQISVIIISLFFLSYLKQIERDQYKVENDILWGETKAFCFPVAFLHMTGIFWYGYRKY